MRHEIVGSDDLSELLKEIDDIYRSLLHICHTLGVGLTMPPASFDTLAPLSSPDRKNAQASASITASVILTAGRPREGVSM